MGGICTTRTSASDLHGHQPISNRNFIEVAASGNLEELSSLISRGNDVDVCDRSGRTALHLASAEGHTALVKLLVKSGCSLNVKDQWGNEPLRDAILNGHVAVKEFLVQAGAILSRDLKSELETKLLQQVRNGDLNSVKNLVECGISLFSTDYVGKSPLHIAVEDGNLQIVAYLLTKNVDLNQIDSFGRTALDIANQNKDQVMKEILMAASLGLSARENRKPASKRASFAIMEACAQPIAAAMIEGREIEPLARHMASLFFSDIVGFTSISSTLSAEKVSRMLNNLFKRLDRLAYLHGVQKVDVVGDAYIAATNFTEEQPDDHAARLARFAIDAVAAAQAVPVDEDDPDRHGCLQVRVGLHCGPVVGIVADRTSLKYTLIGETAVTAARMESSGAAGRIQCSAAAARLIAQQADDVMLRPRSVSCPLCIPAQFSHSRFPPFDKSGQKFLVVGKKIIIPLMLYLRARTGASTQQASRLPSPTITRIVCCSLPLLTLRPAPTSCREATAAASSATTATDAADVSRQSAVTPTFWVTRKRFGWRQYQSCMELHTTAAAAAAAAVAATVTVTAAPASTSCLNLRGLPSLAAAEAAAATRNTAAAEARSQELLCSPPPPPAGPAALVGSQAGE